MERFAEAVKLFRAGEVTLPQLEESFLDCLVATFESSGGMGTRQQIRDVCRQSLKDIGSLAELVGGIGNE